MTALIAGTIALARLLRLSVSWTQRFAALPIYALTLLIFSLLPGVFTLELAPAWLTAADETAQTCFFWAISAAIVVLSWGSDRVALRWGLRPIWGLRLLMLAASIVVGILVWPRLADGGVSGSTGMLLASAAAFMYLCWLGALVFDLAFCWDRYVNQKVHILSRRHSRASRRTRSVAVAARRMAERIRRGPRTRGPRPQSHPEGPAHDR